MYKFLIASCCVLITNFLTKTDQALSRNLEQYNQGKACSMTISIKKYGSMNLRGRFHQYPRSGFCCVAQPLALSYKNSKVDNLMNQAVKAVIEKHDYDTAIINLRRLLQIKELPDARRALLAAYGAKNGAIITQSQELGDCLLLTEEWVWIRITGTGDSFGRF